MTEPPESYTINDEVAAFAQQMASADETMRTILQETLDSADGDGVMFESGRTACGSARNIREPLNRFDNAVELDSCPVDMAGIWHSHVSTSQLLNPEHSLPDTANVVYGAVDVSVVVGAESVEVLIAPDEGEAVQAAFRDAVGVDVNSPEDVIYALQSGAIENPIAARRRVHDALAPLFKRKKVDFSTLASRIEGTDQFPEETMAACPVHSMQVAEEPVSVDGEGHDHEHAGEGEEGEAPELEVVTDESGNPVVAAQTSGQRLREQARRGSDVFQELTEGVSLRKQVIGTAVGVLAGNMVSNFVQGGPQE